MYFDLGKLKKIKKMIHTHSVKLIWESCTQTNVTRIITLQKLEQLSSGYSKTLFMTFLIPHLRAIKFVAPHLMKNLGHVVGIQEPLGCTSDVSQNHSLNTLFFMVPLGTVVIIKSFPPCLLGLMTQKYLTGSRKLFNLLKIVTTTAVKDLKNVLKKVHMKFQYH